LPARLVPIATEAVYATEWLPVAHLLGTKWLPLFQVGAEFGQDDIGHVESEFLGASMQFVADGKPELAARANAVVKELRNAVASSHSNLVFFIG